LRRQLQGARGGYRKLDGGHVEWRLEGDGSDADVA
jgi:hypothetical protein